MDAFADDWYDDAESHPTSHHLNLLTKHVTKLKHSNTTQSKQAKASAQQRFK